MRHRLLAAIIGGLSVTAAQRFYEDVIGLTLTVDQGFAKIYQVSPAYTLRTGPG